MQSPNLPEKKSRYPDSAITQAAMLQCENFFLGHFSESKNATLSVQFSAFLTASSSRSILPQILWPRFLGSRPKPPAILILLREVVTHVSSVIFLLILYSCHYDFRSVGQNPRPSPCSSGCFDSFKSKFFVLIR